MLLAVAAAVAFSAINTSAKSSGTTVSPPSAAEIAKLRVLAVAAAKGSGEAHPTDGVVVATTRKQINRLNGGEEVDSNQDVYVIRLHGNFVAYWSSPPDGASLPRGHMLLLVYDARTNALTDTMVGNYEIPVERLGTPQPLNP